jgi:hypothetical protein
MRALGLVISAFCMATVLALVAGAGYLVATGRLDRQKAAKLVAVVHGLEPFAEPAATVEAHTAAATGIGRSDSLAVQSQNLDVRERFIEGQRSDLEAERRKLTAEQAQLATEREAFKKQRSGWEDGEKAKGIDEAVELIGKLSPTQAKEQILLYLKDREMDWVVSLMRKLAIDRQAKIAGEFTTPEESQKLAEIIRRIRDGQPPLPASAKSP